MVHIGRVDEPVTGCIWAPDGETFTLGALDKSRSLRTFSLKGDLVHDWEAKHRTQDLCGSPDGRWLVAIDDHKKIHVYNAVTRELEYEMTLLATPTSVSISKDSTHILVNKSDGEAQYINLNTRKLVHKFLGHTGGDCLIRANFGGSNESFVVSGSEGKPARGPTRLHPIHSTEANSCRWACVGVAQGNRRGRRATHGPSSACQLGGLEPDRPAHDCVLRR